ncbi:hypothetical protein [Bradyrhizobium sp. NBAIM01]|uniref:hypothetical protein n=1 Tax=Bradyrhizobium sp. NBAIM01 TaxID=2793818 RepID=UPI001CD7E7AB|nr:hypothetical protein [Bradyrhizobium sp. NBAIM01]MCA1513689.1 hypothetical protein [Bradyrhizobium sp. NBAIM01]
MTKIRAQRAENFAVRMQSRAISEPIQARAQFCARSLIDCGAALSLMAPAAARHAAQTGSKRAARGWLRLLFFQTLASKLAAAGRDWDE